MGSFKLSRLSVMMFLQYFIQGSWMATGGLALATYGFSSIIGLTYSLVAIASIIAPIILGVIADRFFSSERVLGILHFLCGGLLFWIPHQLEAGNQLNFLILIFLYLLCLMPTMAITNTIGFYHVVDSERQYPIIRVFGTVGWIVAGIFIGQLGLSSSSLIFTVSAVASIILGFYSFSLPNTPAEGMSKVGSKRDLFKLDAFQLFKNRNFAIFMICAMIVYIPSASYTSFTSNFLGALGFENVGSILTIGQVFEVIFMLMVPLLLVRLGIKYMALIGILAWALRLYLFAYGGTLDITSLIIIGIAIHGICVDFFMITATIYVQKAAPKEIKAQAQSLFVVLTSGIGTFVGSLIAGQLYNSIIATSSSSAQQWQTFWLVPAIIATVLAVFFLFAFKQGETSRKPKSTFETASERG